MFMNTNQKYFKSTNLNYLYGTEVHLQIRADEQLYKILVYNQCYNRSTFHTGESKPTHAEVTLKSQN